MSHWHAVPTRPDASRSIAVSFAGGGFWGFPHPGFQLIGGRIDEHGFSSGC